MKFIELNTGFSVRKSQISVIERVITEEGTDRGCFVTLNDGRQIETPFFYMTLLRLIEEEGDLAEKLNASLDRETFSHQ